MARTIGYLTAETAIRVRVEGLDTSYVANNRYIDWWLYDEDGDEYDSIYGTSVSGGVSNTPWVTFDDLPSNTKFKVKYELFYSSTETGSLDSSVTGTKTIYTDAPAPEIEYFEWDTTKTSNGSFKVTANEWNRLIDKVIEVYDYKGGYDSVSSRYPMNKVSRSDVFYAERFNEVRYAIGSLYSTGLNDKSAGDKIKASDLNQLVTSLNSAIDNL